MKRFPERPVRSGPRGEAVRAIAMLLDPGPARTTPFHPLADAKDRLDARDYGLAMELCQGVVRWRLTLDTILGTFLSKPLEGLPAVVRDSLRAGAYQILYLDRVPDHAAVNEAVAISRKGGGVPFARLTNGVLRNLIRRRDSGDPLLPAIEHGADRLAVANSYPLWIGRRWWERFGAEETEELFVAGNTAPALTLRVMGSAARDEVIEGFRNELRVEAEACAWASRGVRLARGTPVSVIPDDWWAFLQVQDEASQLIAELPEAERGQRVLDACAAPGGKAAILSECVGEQGEVVAVESDPVRTRLLKENLGRLGLGNVEVLEADITSASLQKYAGFDTVLVDAPCTGLGTLRRHPEIKWRRQPVDLNRNGRQSLAMLKNVAPLVRPGGLLVYAVCSTEPEEGEDVVLRFLEGTPEFASVPVKGEFGTSEGFFRSWPHRHGLDGFFAAQLRREG